MKNIFLKIKNTKYKVNTKGFTLIELLVSLSIFSFVVVMAIGALYSAQNYSAKAQGSQVILDGLNFTMETMSREIRYGTNFYCDTNSSITLPGNSEKKDCSDLNNLGKTLYFLPNGNTDRVYYYLFKDPFTGNGIIKRMQIGSSGPEDVTSLEDIDVETFSFYVEGAKSTGLSDYDQPRVTIIIAGKTIPNNVNIKPTIFRIQNTVTQRVLDTVQ